MKIERKKFKHSNHNFLVSKDANYHCMGYFYEGKFVLSGINVSCHIWFCMDQGRWK